MWIDTFGAKPSGAAQGGGDQATRPAPEGDGGDLLDARERDDDQRDQQDDAEPEREGGAGHEIVRLQKAKIVANQAPTTLAATASVTASPTVRIASRQDRQRQQQAEQHGETARASSGRDR